MKKTIVLTGGSKGMGKSTLLKFAENNFDILTCSRKKTDLQLIGDEIRELYPNINFNSIDSDLSNKTGCDKFIDFVNSNTDKVDVLVNNVGTFIPGELMNEDEDALEFMINTNLYSNYRVTRGLSKIFISQKYGHIFNICSIASKVAYENGGSYCISKFALYGFSQCLREEFKKFNVKVTAVLPGATRTGSWDGTSLPDERFINVDDISNSIYAAYDTSPGATVEEIVIRPQLGDI
jgi:short-subunit dehydrogenase